MHEYRGLVTAASYAERTHACAALTDTPFETRVRSRLLFEGTATGNSEREVRRVRLCRAAGAGSARQRDGARGWARVGEGGTCS